MLVVVNLRGSLDLDLPGEPAGSDPWEVAIDSERLCYAGSAQDSQPL